MKVKAEKHFDQTIGWLLELNTYILFNTEIPPGWHEFDRIQLKQATKSGIVRLEKPLHVYWHITNACNFPCSFCSAGKDIDKESVLNATRELTLGRLLDENILKIDFTGGEPLLFKGLCKYATIVKEAGIGSTLTSNGWWLSERASEISGLFDWVIVSIDGAHASTHDRLRGAPGSFDRAVSAVKKLVDIGIRVRINMVASSQNYKEIPDTILLAQSIGASQISIMQFRPVGQGQYTKHQFELDDDLFHRFANSAKSRLATDNFVTNVSNRQHFGGFPAIQPDATVKTLTLEGNPIDLGSLLDSTLTNLWRKESVPQYLRINQVT